MYQISVILSFIQKFAKTRDIKEFRLKFNYENVSLRR